MQEGHLVQARLLAEQALELAPRHPDALHLLGVIALQSGEPDAAVEQLRQAAAIRPDNPDYQANIAYAYVELKRYQEAAAAFEHAARLAPQDPEILLGAANCHALLGRKAEAEAAFRRLVARHPGFALGWFNLGNALKDQKRYEEARESYIRATQLAPQFLEAHCNLGIVLHHLGAFDEAERSYRVCLARKPGLATAYLPLAITLNSLRRHAEAEAACREALAREPGQKNAWPVLGGAILAQRRWSEALQCFERAAREFSGNSDALCHLGDALVHAGRYDDALDALDHACALENVSSYARFVRAFLLQLMGRMAEAGVDYVGRHDRSAFVEQHPHIALASELPRDLRGRTVCLLGEQGIGDQVFFLRYSPLLKARGCRVTYHGTPKVLSVLSRISALDEVLPWTGEFTSADYTLFIGDQPHLLGGALDSSPIQAGGVMGPRQGAAGLSPAFPRHFRVYWPELPPPLKLQPLPDRVAAVRERLGLLGQPPYIGLTWRAGRGPEEQRGQVPTLFKAIPLEALAAALDGVGGTLIALQRHSVAGEIEKLAALIGKPVYDETTANEDLEEMLALLAVADEYVGVSSTNMHLRAGAGGTARVLVPWPPDWRWMAAGNESPWFPGFSIYRQKLNGDWSDALRRLNHELTHAPSPRQTRPL